MFYSKEKTKELFNYHVAKIAANWTRDDFIMGHFTSGKETLIDLRDHKIANYEFRGEGYCRASVEELMDIVDFKNEIPQIVLDAMNTALSGRQQIFSPLVLSRFTEGHKIYVKLDLTPEEADRRYQRWEQQYRSSRKGFW